MSNQKNQKNTNKTRQIELFKTKDIFSSYSQSNKLPIQSHKEIIEWQKKIYLYQKKILKNLHDPYLQKSPNVDIYDSEIKKINPFKLTSHSINFWRSNKLISKSSAIYFVIDKIFDKNIILYIGETFSADERWKGVHDCKTYINNYKETLHSHEIKNHLDIRFLLDVPKDVKFRRKLEKKLIYLWLPPFNKETRNIWSTTFTNI